MSLVQPVSSGSDLETQPALNAHQERLLEGWETRRVIAVLRACSLRDRVIASAFCALRGLLLRIKERINALRVPLDNLLSDLETQHVIYAVRVWLPLVMAKRDVIYANLGSLLTLKD